jgi:hypothetical protein
MMELFVVEERKDRQTALNVHLASDSKRRIE